MRQVGKKKIVAKTNLVLPADAEVLLKAAAIIALNVGLHLVQMRLARMTPMQMLDVSFPWL